MAKRKKVEEGLELPEFDPQEYFNKEREKTKMYILFSILAGIDGAVAAILHMYVSSYVAGLVSILILIVSHYIAKYRVRLELLKLKDRIGPYFSFIFLCLSVWILLINPPVKDLSPPNISGVYFYRDGKWNRCEYYEGIYLVNISLSEVVVKIGFEVTDNSPIKEVKIFVDGEERTCYREVRIYFIEMKREEIVGAIAIDISATDIYGNTILKKYAISIKLPKAVF